MTLSDRPHRNLPLGMLLLLAVSFLFATCNASAAPGPSPFPNGRIGVLAQQGDDRCLSRWQATADYLTAHIPGTRFSIVPLHFDEIDRAAADAAVDFILVNPALYVRLEVRYRATRIATVQTLFGDQGFTLFGGTVFAPADGKVKSLQDIPEATVAAVDRQSLGGWLAFLGELRDKFPELKHGPKDTQFLGTHDKVVEAVRDGRADAGIVRSGTLERWAEEGTIRLADFRIIERPRKTLDEIRYPYALSTPLYPEWPMAKLDNTPDEIARMVAAALLEMPPDCPAAQSAGIRGWTVPLNYQSVHNLLKALRIEPYAHYGEVSALEAARQHWVAISAIALLLAGMAGFAFRSVRLNRRLALSQAEARAELAVRREAERRRNDVERMVQHELRSPLVAVINGLDLLREMCGLDVEQKDILGKTRVKALHMLQVVTLNRALVMMEEGTFAPSPEWTDLHQVLTDIAAEYGPSAKSAGPPVRLRAPSPPSGDRDYLVAGDPLLFHILLRNLIRNAVEASPADSGSRRHSRTGRQHRGPGAQPGRCARGHPRHLLRQVRDLGQGFGHRARHLHGPAHHREPRRGHRHDHLAGHGTEVWVALPAAS